MVVETLDGGCGLLEADVVETSKGSAADVFDCVVGDEKLLLHSREREFLGIHSSSFVRGAPRKPASCILAEHVLDNTFTITV